MLLAAWLGSTDRRHIRWRTVAWGLGLQLLFAFIVLRFSYGQNALQLGRRRSQRDAGLHHRRHAGAVWRAGHRPNTSFGTIFAFQVLPTIIFISAFFAVLYHIGVMQIVIRGLAWVMLKTMRISGAESMNVAASIFMGQTEAPLTIRPFLAGPRAAS